MSFKKSIFIAIQVFILVACSSNDETTENITPEEISIAQEIHQLINEHRTNIGKNTLIYNEDAASLALSHTKYMISKNKISHDNFDDRFSELNKLVNASSLAENVASNQKTASKVVNAWLNSAGHKKNIEGDFTYTGIGVQKNSSGIYYFTQLSYSN